MIVPAVIEQKHSLLCPYVAEVAGRVRDVVRGYCDDRGFAFLSRVKTIESIAEKIETGRYTRWSDVDDLFACSIVIPTLTDETPVLNMLEKSFKRVQIKARGSTQKDPEVFRFDTTRFIGKINPSTLPNASAEILGVAFEVQIRTAFEHAWSSTMHALTYKGTQIDWRRLRLAAQLRAATEQLDQLVAGFENNAGLILEQKWPDVAAQQSIEVFFKKLFERNAIPSEVAPDNWSRFCQNLFSAIKSANRGRRYDQILAAVPTSLDAIEAEIEEYSLTTFPRSISLLQLCLGALTKRKVITTGLGYYTPLVTEELRDLYPLTSILGTSFIVDG